MSQEDRIKRLLEKNYRKVVEEYIGTEDKTEEKYALFQRNLNRIDDSLANNIDEANATLAEQKQAHAKILANFKKQHTQALEELQASRREIEGRFEQDLADIDEILEKKRSENLKREQKIEAEYIAALRTTEKQYKEQRQAFEKQLEVAREAFEKHSETLEQETEIKRATQQNTHEERMLQLSKTIDDIKDKSEKEIESLNAQLKEYEKQFASAIQKAKQAYEAALEPIRKDRTDQGSTHAEELAAIQDRYENEITKKSKYMVEKQKLGDDASADAFAKEIKRLKKEHKEEVDSKEAAHAEALAAIDAREASVTNSHQESLFNLKKQGIQKIHQFLNNILLQKTQEIIDINNVNSQSLRQEALHKHQHETIDIDQDIQQINFDQTLEEANLYGHFSLTLTKPKEALEKEARKQKYNEEKNALTEVRNTARHLHRKDADTRKLKHQLELEQNRVEQHNQEANHLFNIDNAVIDDTIAKIRLDRHRESQLSRHYYLQARNYTALKQDTVQVRKPFTLTDINTHKQLLIKDYKAMIKKAEEDHKLIGQKIMETYEKEIVIYETAYVSLEKEHQQTIQTLTTEQALDRNLDLEQIAKLDPKKEKMLIRKYKRNLALKQENHDEALAIKKRELEQKLAVYKKTIEQIKAFKMHSLEEADTLLMHIKDQLHEAIDRAEKAAEQAVQDLERLQYEIRHSADLFETFQRQRHEDTTHTATTYEKARLDKEEALRNRYKKRLQDTLEAIKKAYAAFESTNKAQQNATLDLYKESLDDVHQTKEENLKTIIDQASYERKKLELYITKLEKKYDMELRNLSDSKEQEKQDCFFRKEQADLTLNKALQTYEREATASANERIAIKQEDQNRFKQNEQILLDKIKHNAIKLLNEEDVPHVRAMLQGSRDIQLNG
ncbi:MAG: hypothetical protein EA374_08375 [Acholeplasmatales bacterium]|nr:MAG: hypothetical protein EA374_08375 [Acholeplasmatales bacterium]